MNWYAKRAAIAAIYTSAGMDSSVSIFNQQNCTC